MNTQLSLKTKLKSLGTDILSSIEVYKKQKPTITAERELNIQYLQTILKVVIDTPLTSEYKTPDALGKLIHTYLTGATFKTGIFNGSTLRDKLFAVLEKKCPLIFVKKEDMQKHYQQISTDLEKISHDLEKSLQKIISLNRTIDTIKATVDVFDSSTNRLKASDELIKVIDAQKLELNNLREELATEQETRMLLEQTVQLKSDAIERLQTTLMQIKEKSVAEKTEGKKSSLLQSSFTMYAASGRAKVEDNSVSMVNNGIRVKVI
jgi:hypothetical protein